MIRLITEPALLQLVLPPALVLSVRPLVGAAFTALEGSGSVARATVLAASVLASVSVAAMADERVATEPVAEMHSDPPSPANVADASVLNVVLQSALDALQDE